MRERIGLLAAPLSGKPARCSRARRSRRAHAGDRRRGGAPIVETVHTEVVALLTEKRSQLDGLAEAPRARDAGRAMRTHGAGVEHEPSGTAHDLAATANFTKTLSPCTSHTRGKRVRHLTSGSMGHDHRPMTIDRHAVARRDEAVLDDAKNVLRAVVSVPIEWALAVAALAILSLLDISRQAGGGVEMRFHLTTITASLVALVWLPGLIRVIAIAGGAIKTPAGEATVAGGLMELIRDIDPETRRQALPALVAIADAAETESTGPQRVTARRVRSELEDELAAVAAPTGSIDDVLKDLASRYEGIRSTQPPGSKRTFEMNELVAEARSLANLVTADQIRQLFEEGGEGNRIVALALIEASPSNEFFDLVLDGIANSQSAFEQFHALRAMRDMLQSLDRSKREQLGDAISAERRDARGLGIREDASRWSLLSELARSLEPRPSVRRADAQRFEREVVEALSDAGAFFEEDVPTRTTGRRPDFLVRVGDAVIVVEAVSATSQEAARRVREAVSQAGALAADLPADHAFVVVPDELIARVRGRTQRPVEIVSPRELRDRLVQIRNQRARA
jgi:hypothetical protein